MILVFISGFMLFKSVVLSASLHFYYKHVCRQYRISKAKILFKRLTGPVPGDFLRKIIPRRILKLRMLETGKIYFIVYHFIGFWETKSGNAFALKFSNKLLYNA